MPGERDDHVENVGKLQATLDQTKVNMGQQSKDFEARLAQKGAETGAEAEAKKAAEAEADKAAEKEAETKAGKAAEAEAEKAAKAEADKADKAEKAEKVEKAKARTTKVEKAKGKEGNIRNECVSREYYFMAKHLQPGRYEHCLYSSRSRVSMVEPCSLEASSQRGPSATDENAVAVKANNKGQNEEAHGGSKTTTTPRTPSGGPDGQGPRARPWRTR
jgi:hypothetical protein